MAMVLEEFLEISRRALRSYPLCDRCLGRLLARLGYGLGNAERGRAAKLILLMEYHRLIASGDENPLKEFSALAPNMGSVARELYRWLSGSEPQIRGCALCGDRLGDFLVDVSKRASGELSSRGISRFAIGVRVSSDVKRVEEDLIRISGSPYYERLKSEIGRELGKMIESLSGVEADPRDPEAFVIVGFPEGSINIEVRSMLVKVRYRKKWRGIRQSRARGKKRFSIEEAASGILELVGGSGVILHAAGREDIDARMLGPGRPAIVEVKAPRKRTVDLVDVERALNRFRDLVEFEAEGFARRSEVKRYKMGSAASSKIYRALVLVERSVSEKDLEALEKRLRGAEVRQRTPTRTIHRRPDIERIKKIHDIRCTKIAENLIECLVKTSGGLYVKELVSGDKGRTRPSFTELLGAEARCIELDVVSVEPS